jgi:hypothetical protein
MATIKTRAPQSIYQLKITLLGTKPPIWRRALVPSEFTLDKLHRVLQAVMGWEDSHLHEFRVGRQRFGIPDLEDDFMGGPRCIHERKVRLSEVLGRTGAKLDYTYDFGDSWEHTVTLEKILLPDADQRYPRCTAGKLRCPPEDCGGIGGFYNFLEAIDDPEHEQHDELLEWIGGTYDPEAFSLDAVNLRLGVEFRLGRQKPAKKAAPRKTSTKTPASQRTTSLKSNPTTRATVAALIQSLGSHSPPVERQRIPPGEKVPVELSGRDRELIVNHTFADADLTGRLRIVPKPGVAPIFHFTLEDLDQLAGYVAAEANHATNKNLRKELRELFDRIDHVLCSYSEETD